MRITERDAVLTIEDRPGCIWLFGFWFVAGGVLAIAMAFVAVNAHELAWWERTLAVVIGAGCAAGGLFVIGQAPSIVTILHRGTDRATMRIRGLGKREELVFRCRDVIVVEMREEKDSDGDPVYQLRLGLRTGAVLPLHSVQRHGREWLEERRAVIRRFLDLPASASPS